MKKALLVLACLAFVTASFGQARLVLNNNAWMVIDNQAWVVLENPATNALTTLGTGGNILSENEFDRLRWQIGATTGIYTVPFTTPSAIKMPLTYNKTTAGVLGVNSSVVFATYNYGLSVPAWDNFIYRPSDVTHMNYNSTGVPNNSGNVVDRFWIIDTKSAGFSYTTSPDATLTFIYDPADVTPQTINGTTPLNAQRFNSALSKWADVLYPTCVWTNLGATRQVVTPSIPSAQFWRSWTLSDKLNPLPIELTDFRANCEGSQVLINWTTASEQDNDYFNIEKSNDGVAWTVIGTVDGAGNSSELINYSFVDVTPTGVAYYRLAQVDLDGTTTHSDMVVAGCEANGGLDIVNVFDDGNDVNVIVSSSFDAVHDVALLDVQGKMMSVKLAQTISTGITQIRLPKGTLATGVYVVRLSNSDQVLSRKVVLN